MVCVDERISMGTYLRDLGVVLALLLLQSVNVCGRCSIEPVGGQAYIPTHWTRIEDGAFSGCSDLIHLQIQGGVTSVGQEAFRDCTNLESVTFGDSVTVINDRAFRGCRELRSVTFGKGLINIGVDVFTGCSNLKKVSISENVTSIDLTIAPHCRSELPGEFVGKPILSEESISVSNLIREARHHSKYAKSWSSSYYHDLPLFLKKHFGSKTIEIIEIGTCFGGNALAILKALPFSVLHIIDPFLPNYDSHDSVSERFNGYARDKNMTDAHFSEVWAEALFYEMRARFGCRYHLHHNFSTSAVLNFPDIFADAIFIDGLHTYEGVQLDLKMWTRKTKNGGLVILNDYGHQFPGVKRAVDEFTTKNSLNLSVGKVGRGPGNENAFFYNEVPII